MKLTVNFVPSLVQQLAGGGRRRASTRGCGWRRIAERRGTPPSARFAVERFFSLNWDRSVRAAPALRASCSSASASARARRLQFRRRCARSDGAVQPRLARLRGARRRRASSTRSSKRGAAFRDADLALVVDRQRRACARVLPLYRELAARGQVELSSSPFYHPIVPLLDRQRARARARCPIGDAAAAASPIPSDADAQIVRGADGPRARLRRAAARHVAARGLGLAGGGRRLRARRHRLARHRRGQPVALAGDVAARRTGAAISIASGATAASTWSSAIARSPTRSASPTRTATPRAGVADLLARARVTPRASRRRRPASRRWCPSSSTARTRGSRTPATASRSCARSSSALSSRPRAAAPRRSASHLDAGAGAPRAARAALGLVDRLGLPHLDRRSRQEPRLGAARPRARPLRPRASPRARTPAQRDAAYEHLLAAEGSDWFWWFGEPFHSMEDALFDALFRAHLAGAYQALGLPRAARARRAGRRARRRAHGDAAAGVRAPWGFIRPHDRRHTASTTGRAPAAIACRAAPPWPTRRSSPPSSSASIARCSICASSRPTAAPPSSPPRASRSTSPSARRATATSILSSTPEAASTVDGERDGGTRRHGRTVELAVPFGALGAAPDDRLLLTFRLFAGGRAAGALPRRRRARAHRPRRRIRSRELVGVVGAAWAGRRRRGGAGRRAAPRAPRRRTAPSAPTSRYFCHASFAVGSASAVRVRPR